MKTGAAANGLSGEALTTRTNASPWEIPSQVLDFPLNSA